MIRYLIKFVDKFDYAKMLQNGQFFMRPLSYYRFLEIGQGDSYEGAVSHSIAMFKNAQWPICCFYSVDVSDILNDGSVCIPKRCLDDFKCFNGYAVVIDYEKFEKLLSSIDTKGFQLSAGKVVYRYIEFEELVDMMKADAMDNVFIKRPDFAYQKEYRIVITKNVPEDNDSVVYKMKSNIKSLSNIIPISTLKADNNGNLILTKENLFLERKI